MEEIRLKDFNIDNTGKTIVTDKIQALLDKAMGKKIIIDEGKYQVSSLFIKSDTTLVLDKNATLFATTKEDEYPILDTRVAGIEMPWYVGILNVIDAENVTIEGEGAIDGSGPYWWEKYWGKDMNGGMRQKYDKLGLRFACDYDCKRTRNVLVSNSKNINLKEFKSID
jgi:polygalacturonase